MKRGLFFLLDIKPLLCNRDLHIIQCVNWKHRELCEKKEAVISEVSSSVSESPVLFRDSDTVIDFELIYLILLRQSPGNTPEILTRAKNDRLAPDPNRHSRESGNLE